MKPQANSGTFRHYLTFFAGQQTSLLGSSVAQFAIIWWITVETGSPIYLSLAALSGLTPAIIVMPFAGVLVDRWNRKTVIAIADFLQALTTIALVLLFWSGLVTVWLVFLTLALRGACQGFHQPATNAIIPLMVPTDKLSRMNGINYVMTGTMALIGPVAGAILLSIARIEQILWIDPLTFIVALMPLLAIKIPVVRCEHEESSFRHDFAEGLGFIRKSTGFVTLTMLATALNFLLTPLSTLLPYYVKFDHFGEASSLAVVYAALQGGMLAGGFMMSVLKGFNRKMAASAFFIYLVFIGYAVVALTPTGAFWIMAAGSMLIGFAVAPANVLINTIFQMRVPLQMQGRINSVTTSLASAAQPLGMLLAGGLVEFTSTASLFLMCTTAGLVTLTLSWFFTDIRLLDSSGDQLSLKDITSQT